MQLVAMFVSFPLIDWMASNKTLLVLCGRVGVGGHALLGVDTLGTRVGDVNHEQNRLAFPLFTRNVPNHCRKSREFTSVDKKYGKTEPTGLASGFSALFSSVDRMYLNSVAAAVHVAR